MMNENDPTRPLTGADALRNDVPHYASANAIDLVEIGIALGNDKRRLLTFFLCFLLMGALISLLLPDKYKASTMLLPPRSAASSFDALSSFGALAALNAGVAPTDSASGYAALLSSRSVLDILIARFNLLERYHKKYPDNVRQILLKNAVVALDKKSGFIEVSVTDRDPEFAADLANGYADGLKLVLSKLAITSAQQRSIFYQKQVDETLAKISASELTLERARVSGGLVSLDSQVAGSIATAAELKAKITSAEIEMATMKTYATAENADLQRLQAATHAMRYQLTNLQQGEGDNASETVSSREEGKRSLANIRAFRELKFQQGLLEQLRSQLELAKIDEAKEGAMVQQVYLAVPPHMKAGPSPVLLTLACGFFGLFLGLIQSALRFFWAKNTESGNKLLVLRMAWSFRKHA